MDGDAKWHRGQTLAAGQVAEFKVWAELVRQSIGRLHVFLPLRDMGIDGVVHRLADGAYLAVQVKGRTELTPAGQVHITVTATSLGDGDALLVGVLVDGEQLGRMILVAPESKFGELAAHDVVDGRDYLTAAFAMREGGRSKWAPYLVARERLAERFGAEFVGTTSAEEFLALGVDRGREGFLGETEVIRRLAEAASLNLFRPFPDLETVEVLARHVLTRRFLGLQVKTVGWDKAHLENRVYVRRSSFRPSPSTFICVLGWNRDAGRFEDDCLVIPSEELAGLARVEGEWMMLELEPGGVRHRRLERFRKSLLSLGSTVESMLA
ncbi:MAG: hypothetical protein M3003_10715 [Candidatus Dormibacteraeota bacterium]|nr:hypothetical protein [Candidatus Dormibacteraeota bacterium]